MLVNQFQEAEACQKVQSQKQKYCKKFTHSDRNKKESYDLRIETNQKEGLRDRKNTINSVLSDRNNEEKCILQIEILNDYEKKKRKFKISSPNM